MFRFVCSVLMGTWSSLVLAESDFQANGPNQFSYVIDSNKPRWQSNTIAWYYNDTQQPAGFTTAEVVELIKNAGRKWEGVCNVRFSYMGVSKVKPDLDATYLTTDSLSVIGWDTLTGSRAGLGGFSGYRYIFASNGAAVMQDADVVINLQGDVAPGNARDLEALITHEMGHMLSLDHSDKQASVMFASPYNNYAFMQTLRADDAAACAAIYGSPASATADRVFNWAEQRYGKLFAPTGTTSVEGFGYHYRYYATTRSYLGSKEGQLFYLSTDGVLSALGDLQRYLQQAEAEGF
ncbi:matrixin family metalloprotease [Parachitinimonas caeni]|uniref:Matrixin family metalloprotease n=1 Tax=Parachitinimonas caeni TaxID=3031301 RepID=A0ABT7E0L9_9NEIS|nr:matrixin family metalloprotease [Parachitinimonas caeni]MDK2124883.1 matrixin family metalloprotease [Parachitinimonas caeni]